MNCWQRSISICLIALLTVYNVESLIPTVTALNSNPKYSGTKAIGDQLDIHFSKYNNSIIYQDVDNYVGFTVSFGRWCFRDYMSLGAMIYSVTYKASWEDSTISVYNWSYHDPANLNDDDANPKQSIDGNVSLDNARLGNLQITVTATAGSYVTNFTTYSIYTVMTSTSLNFTMEPETPKTPTPTFSYESGILWQTNIQWNLTGTPAQNLWESDIERKERTWTNPVIRDGIVYAAATSSVLLNRYGHPATSWIDIYAFDASSGSVIWDHHDNYSKVTNLAIENGVIYFGGQGGDYYDALGNRWNPDSMNAIDASDGNLLWRTPLAVGFSSPVACGGKVFIGSWNSVLALDGVTGIIIWNYTTNAGVLSSPTVANSVVYIGSYDANLYALDAETGIKIWNFTAQQGFFFAPTIADGVVYASSQDGYVYALNAATGVKIWSYDTSPPKIVTTEMTDQTFDPTTPSIYKGILYVSSSGLPYNQSIHDYGLGYSTVYALDPHNGQKIWNYTVDRWGIDSPAIFNGIIYVNIWPYTIYGLDASNGAKVWNYSEVYTDPVIDNGIIYLGIDQQIYAILTPGYTSGIITQDASPNSNLLISIVIILTICLATFMMMYRKTKKTKT